jgi:hypothetical protein
LLSFHPFDKAFPFAALVFGAILLSHSLTAQVELVGRLTPDELLGKLPEWRAHFAAYSPDLEAVANLQKISEDLTIEIFLGTWCSDSRQHVSAYVKNPLVRTVFTGIPRDRAARSAYTKGKNIERVPTFIILFRNQEIGRIVETPQVSVEADIWNILQPWVGTR